MKTLLLILILIVTPAMAQTVDIPNQVSVTDLEKQTDDYIKAGIFYLQKIATNAYYLQSAGINWQGIDWARINWDDLSAYQNGINWASYTPVVNNDVNWVASSPIVTNPVNWVNLN